MIEVRELPVSSPEAQTAEAGMRVPPVPPTDRGLFNQGNFPPFEPPRRPTSLAQREPRKPAGRRIELSTEFHETVYKIALATLFGVPIALQMGLKNPL